MKVCHTSGHYTLTVGHTIVTDTYSELTLDEWRELVIREWQGENFCLCDEDMGKREWTYLNIPGVGSAACYFRSHVLDGAHWISRKVG